MPRWMPPNMAEETERADINAATLVRCRCGLRTAADMMIRVPPTVDPAQPYVCDGCRETMFREGKMSRAGFIKHHGGPADLVRRFGGRP